MKKQSEADKRAAARLLIADLAQRRIDNARKFDQLIDLAAAIQNEIRQDFARLLDLMTRGTPEYRDLESARIQSLAPWIHQRFEDAAARALSAAENGDAPDARYEEHLPTVLETLQLAGLAVADGDLPQVMATARSVKWTAATEASDQRAASPPVGKAPSDPDDADGLSPLRSAAVVPMRPDDFPPVKESAVEPGDADGLRPVKPTALLSMGREPAVDDPTA